MVHTEATLKSLNKPDSIKLVFQMDSEMNSDIKELTSEIRHLATQMKKVKDDVAIVKNVNEKLVNQLIETEWWANAQYSRQECLEVVGMPNCFDYCFSNESRFFPQKSKIYLCRACQGIVMTSSSYKDLRLS